MSIFALEGVCGLIRYVPGLGRGVEHISRLCAVVLQSGQGLRFSCVYGPHWSTFSGVPSWRNPPRLGFVLSGCHFARLIDTRGSLNGPGTSPELSQLISVWQD